LTKHLLKQFADRLPSPLQLNSELERWHKKCNDLLKMDDDRRKKWLNEVIKETDSVLYPNVHYLSIFFATLPAQVEDSGLRKRPERGRKITGSGRKTPKIDRIRKQYSGDRIRLPVLTGSCLFRAETDKSGHRNRSPEYCFRFPVFSCGIQPVFLGVGVPTASAERSFSQLSRIKSYYRSTMKQNRLNGLDVAYIHKDLDINPDEILKLYTQMNSRRFDFGV